MRARERRFSKTERAWILYDWANSVYATNIMAAIFPIYFAMAATDTGDKIYGFAVSAANLIVALLSPLLGAIGDFRGMKKKLLQASCCWALCLRWRWLCLTPGS